MPITKTIELFQYSELSETAKEKARYWWESCRDASDLDSVIEDFSSICDILGVDLKTHAVSLYGGGTRQDPDVSWDLGNGGSASFSARYHYAKGAAQKIREYTGSTDSELSRIADALQEVQRRNMYGITATVTDSNRYGMEVETEGRTRELSHADHDAIAESLRDLARWLHSQLMKEDEYQSSEEYITDAMEANEYTFRDDGKRED